MLTETLLSSQERLKLHVIYMLLMTGAFPRNSKTNRYNVEPVHGRPMIGWKEDVMCDSVS